MARVDQQELKRFRGIDFAAALPQFPDHVKRDPTFEPIKVKASARWHVTAGGRELELLSFGPRFYDTRQRRGDGGAIDLVMRLYRRDFNQAVERLRAL